TDPLDVAEDRPSLGSGDLLQPAPHVDTFHVRDGCDVKCRGEIPVRTAEVDVLLNGPPALQCCDLDEVFPCPRLGLLDGCRHGGFLVARGSVDARVPRVWSSATLMRGHVVYRLRLLFPVVPQRILQIGSLR